MRFPKSVLIAGPVFEDTFADNIIHTLRAMSILPLLDEKETRKGMFFQISRFASEFAERGGLDWPSAHQNRLLALARKHRPELFLSPTIACDDSFLLRLREAGVRHCVAWWGDAPGNMTRMGLLSREWDLLFFKDPDAVRKFQRVGLNAHLLHEAMNPIWHRPLAEQKNSELAVVGNFYGYRQFLVMELLKRGVQVGMYGGRLPRWSYPEIKRLHRHQYIVREGKSQVFGEAMACLNSTQIVEGNSLNCRAFEIAGAGGLQVMEYKPIISTCFEPGKEILTFDSLDELMAHLDRARRFPKEVRPIREAGARRALSSHTYRHRLEAIFRLVAT